MGLRDGLLGLSKEKFFEDVPTKIGIVRVKAPMASRIEEFRKALGGDKKQLPQTAGVLVAISCYDPETDKPLFGPSDVAELDLAPPAAYAPITDAIARLGDGLTLDPTTPATPTG